MRPEGADEVFGTLQKIRHTLMHGKRLEDIEKELPCTKDQVLEMVAWIAHTAISLMFVEKEDARPPSKLTLMKPDQIARNRIVAGTHVQTSMLRGDPNNPRIEDFPNFEVSLVQTPFRREP